MAAHYISIHPTHPQPRLVAQAVAIIRDGGVIAYPTDSSYALGCNVGDRNAVDRIRRIRGIDERHPLTLVCRDLSEIARYARIDDWQFRLLKRGTPGGYTFLLPATRQVPRRLVHPRRRTIGIRVPDHPVALALLAALNEPLLSATLTPAGMTDPLHDPETIREHCEHQLDLIVDGGVCDGVATSVIDLVADPPQVVRQGRGDLARLGLQLGP
jgi:tRNA threonylcarbamoyl adenosine modification protein (Sua5/YciO/YrdC/YwlC family)